MDKTQASKRPSNLEVLVVSAEARAVATALTAVSGAITLVALSFALYAFMDQFVSNAAAAALTSLLFAVVTALIAMLVPKLIRAKAERARPADRSWMDKLRPVVDASVMVAGAAAEAIAYRKIRGR